MADREVKVAINVDTEEYRAAIARIRDELGTTPAWGVKLATALGYEPESWDGVWKLTAKPFTFGPDYVLVEEVVYKDGTHDVVIDGDCVVTRHVRHPLPQGWTTEPMYRVVPPEA